ncbi:MAG: aminotransferase class IV [Solirubrobacterales bacterium]
MPAPVSPSAPPTPALASVDGLISPSGAASIRVTDEGLIRGDGVFEVIRLYGGRPFALPDHLDRIERSGAAVELVADRDRLEAEIEALLGAFGSHEGQLRVVLTRGGRRILLTEPLPARGATLKLATVTYSPSVILNGVKTLSYAANMQATRLAQHAGADEAVLVRPDGIVLEAPTSALFWADAHGTLRTPQISEGILESITRARLIDALEVEEGSFTAAELRGADEAFLASTTREVQPISSVDDIDFPEPPGPCTREAIDAFAAVLEKEL